MGREIWKQVPNWPAYEVSAFGRIRRGSYLLSPTKSVKYLKVTLSCGSEKRQVQMQTLVLECFRGLRPDGLEARHLNGDGVDNRLNNLVWGTRRTNALDRIKHGTWNRGERVPQSKLTEREVRAIRHLGGRIADRVLAAAFNVARPTITNIVNGDTWAYLGKENK
jgi:hypothetical protein